MGNDDDGVLEVSEEVREPGDGAGVEVVRRFVEEEEVRLAEEGLGQEHLHLFGTAEVADIHIMQVLGNAKVAEKFSGIAFSSPSPHFPILRLQIRRTQAFFLSGIRVHVDRVLFLRDGIHLLVPHDDRIQHLLVFIFEVVLLQNGHAVALVQRDRAARGVLFAGNDLEQG